MSWTVACLAAALQISAADAQGNIDAGKTPAQIFGDTCAGCHRSARELRRASASFLRSHYTAGSDEASAMANYLAGVGGNEPRSNAAAQPQPKRPPSDVVAKQPAARPAVEQAKAGTASGAAPAQPQTKSRPTTSAQARALPDARGLPEARAFSDERHTEPTLSSAPPAPVLQPFEE
jgi:mono/diheme cytochrome c family protein